MIPYKFARYEDEEAMDLYIEFLNIPNNNLSFEVPNDLIITKGMMHTFINAAYHVQGKSILQS